MTTPRLRPELHATPSEEQGVSYFDVSDPASGSRMRMYDFEWLLASQMDGHRSLDDIARWAKGSLHLDVTGTSLATYVERLRELGFFTDEPAAEPVAAPPVAVTKATHPQTLDEDIAVEMTGDDEDDTQTIKHEALPPRMAEPEPPAPVAPAAAAPKATAPGRDDTERPYAVPAFRETPTATKSPAPSAEAPDKPARSSAGVIGLILVLLGVGGVYAYVSMGGGGGAKVTTQIAQLRDRIDLYPGSATLGGAGPQTLSFGEAGKVTDVVAVGTEVKAGMPLATLEGYAKVEKDITDVKDRLGFYQKQLDAATAKGAADAQKAAEAKVAEKKKALADLEGKAAKLRLVAPGPGTVAKVNVTAGSEAKPDVPAVELSAGRPVVVFKVNAPDLKAGDDATLRGPGNITAPGKIVKVAEGQVTVEPIDNTFKPGDEIQLVKSKAPPAIAVPPAAFVKSEGADAVFVFANGEVHLRKVTISSRTPTEVYVGSGLNPGDQVVTGGVSGLKDGQKASNTP